MCVIIRINSFKVLNNRIFYKCGQTFTMTNNMASSALENVIPINIYNYDGWQHCVISDTWCQMVWHIIVDAAPHTYLML